jgi:formate dehydrogenase major subunit
LKLTRRSFLKLSAASGAGALLTALGVKLSPVFAHSYELKMMGQYRQGVCPFCSAGCTTRSYTGAEARLVHIEGNRESPFTKGGLCAKGCAALFLTTSPDSLLGEKYCLTEKSEIPQSWGRRRDAGAKDWSLLGYDTALDEISKLIIDTRSGAFDESNGRTEAIGVLGGAQLTNEECYSLAKLARSLGIVYLDSEVRDSYMSVVRALTATTGWPVTSNQLLDVRNTKCALIIGANPAENQPVAMGKILEAQARRAKIIVVDPRFTRTAAKADHYVRIRPGTDMAFIGGLINFIIKNGRFHTAYMAHHTNMPFKVNKDFKSQLERFDGNWDYDPKTRKFKNQASWTYKYIGKNPDIDSNFTNSDSDPNSVFSIVKKHFERYDYEKVCRITGIRESVFKKVALEIANSCDPTNTMSVMFSSGVTTGTNGTAAVHGLAILQMLLGNLGRTGGGLNYYHPYPNGQGAFDMGMAASCLPGHFPMPMEGDNLEKYLSRNTVAPLVIGKRDQALFDRQKTYFRGFLSAWYTSINPESAFDNLPREKPGKDYSFRGMLDAVHAGKVKGLIIFDYNPMVTAPDSAYLREALSKLDWLVVVDLFETETASFWKENASAGAKVYLVPGRPFTERAGSLTASDRIVRYNKEVTSVTRKTTGELEFIHDLFALLQAHYNTGRGVFGRPMQEMRWPFEIHGTGEGGSSKGSIRRDDSALLVSREINGYRTSGGAGEGAKHICLAKPEDIKDGSNIVCGNWMYTGSVSSDVLSSDKLTHNGQRSEESRTTLDQDEAGIYPLLGWAWPNNTRILYNKASCGPLGTGWTPGDKISRWKTDKGWTSEIDVPDGAVQAADEIAKNFDAFWRTREGVACAFAPDMVLAGAPPLPEYYEPLESYFVNELSNQQNNPMCRTKGNRKIAGRDELKKYPCIGICFSVAEHQQDGSRTRNMLPLRLAVPEAFCEIGEELADKLKIETGRNVKVTSPRGSVTMKALVTPRMQVLRVMAPQLGEKRSAEVHMVGLCDNFGFQGAATAKAPANALAPLILEPVSGAFKVKSFVCKVEKA